MMYFVLQLETGKIDGFYYGLVRVEIAKINRDSEYSDHTHIICSTKDVEKLPSSKLKNINKL